MVRLARQHPGTYLKRMASNGFFTKLIPLRFRKSVPVVHHVRLSGAIGIGSPMKPALTLKSVNDTLQRAFARLQAGLLNGRVDFHRPTVFPELGTTGFEHLLHQSRVGQKLFHQCFLFPALLRKLGDVLYVAEPGFIGDYLSGGRNVPLRPVVLRQVMPAEGAGIYGDRAAWVRSEALMRLDFGAGRLPGMLVLGAEDPHQFKPTHGTDLLAFFAGVFERTMRRWLS